MNNFRLDDILKSFPKTYEWWRKNTLKRFVTEIFRVNLWGQSTMFKALTCYINVGLNQRRFEGQKLTSILCGYVKWHAYIIVVFYPKEYTRWKREGVDVDFLNRPFEKHRWIQRQPRETICLVFVLLLGCLELEGWHRLMLHLVDST